MSLRVSEAVVLKAFNWSESSRTVCFFTSEYGKLSLHDKGGRSMKSKRGRIIPFSILEITYYHSEKETSGYLSESNLVTYHPLEKDGSMGRLAYASAACELLYILLPEEESQRALYTYFTTFLKLMDQKEKQFLPAIFVAFYLRVLSQLGYHPSIAYCAGCGKEVEKNGTTVKFSGERGGVVCPACQKPTEYYISFSFEKYGLLKALQTASLNEAATLPLSLAEANLLLEALTSFIGHQADVKTDLKSLGFIEKLKNSQS